MDPFFSLPFFKTHKHARLSKHTPKHPSSAVKEGWGNLERNERQPLSCHQLFPGPKAPAEESSHGGRERQRKRKEREKEREVHVQLPALSGWRVIEEEEGKSEKKRGTQHGIQPAAPSRSHFYLLSSISDSPFGSWCPPPFVPIPSFLLHFLQCSTYFSLRPLCHSLLFASVPPPPPPFKRGGG